MNIKFRLDLGWEVLQIIRTKLKDGIFRINNLKSSGFAYLKLPNFLISNALKNQMGCIQKLIFTILSMVFYNVSYMCGRPGKPWL